VRKSVCGAAVRGKERNSKQVEIRSVRLGRGGKRTGGKTKKRGGGGWSSSAKNFVRNVSKRSIGSVKK